jgi:benzylsuccinate CoA-transferase BbsE subunit
VDISIQECVASWVEAAYVRYQYCHGQMTTRYGSKLFSAVPTGVYRCKDGYFCIAGVGRWNPTVCWLIEEGIDVGDLADPKYETMDGILLVEHRSRIEKLMIELGAKYTKLELMLEGQKRGVPITIMGTAKDVYEDKHLNARNFFEDVDHPILGRLRYPGAPFKMSASPWRTGSHAPLIGEHNEEVYSSLGFSRQDMATMKAAGVI